MAPEYKPKGNCIVGAAGKEDPLFNALINNHVYQHGFQLVTEGCGYTWAIYRWHLPAGYTKFSAGFAMGAGNGCNQITV